MAAPRPAAPALVNWLAIFGAMSASVLVYGGVAFVFGRSGEPPETARPLRMALWGAALVALFAAQRLIAPYRKALAGGPGMPRPDTRSFFGRSIVALALAEAAAILGLVLVFSGGSLSDFLLLGMLALLVDFAVILPAGLAFFARGSENRPS